MQECKRHWYTDLSTTHSKNKFTWFNYFITFKINDKSSYYTLCRSWCVHSILTQLNKSFCDFRYGGGLVWIQHYTGPRIGCPTLPLCYDLKRDHNPAINVYFSFTGGVRNIDAESLKKSIKAFLKHMQSMLLSTLLYSLDELLEAHLFISVYKFPMFKCL